MKETAGVKSDRSPTGAFLPDLFCEGCLVVGGGHGPQAEVAQGVGPGPLVEH